MGRLIDANVLREEVNSWGMNDYEPSDFIDAIDDSPTVEAIPKANHEARLKSDMVAMLTDIQMEIHELENPYPHDYDNLLPLAQHNGFYDAKSTIEDLVEQEIDKLRGDNE